jgi:hypothetical protein
LISSHCARLSATAIRLLKGVARKTRCGSSNSICWHSITTCLTATYCVRQVNVAFRYFLDLSLESPLPVSSFLSQFRTRLGDQRFQQVFHESVRQAREKGLVKDRLRLKDATHVIADIAIPSTLRLLAQTRAQLLAAAESFAAPEVAAHQQQADEIRQTTADLKDEQHLLARVAHLREIVAWADDWAARLTPTTPTDRPPLTPEQQTAFHDALQVAHKVLNDREPKAQDKLVSLVDQEARHGMHCGYFTGFQIDVSMDADAELICALDVLAGNGDEGSHAQALIEEEEAIHHPSGTMTCKASRWTAPVFAARSCTD